jgi:hypothetical protein
MHAVRRSSWTLTPRIVHGPRYEPTTPRTSKRPLPGLLVFSRSLDRDYRDGGILHCIGVGSWRLGPVAAAGSGNASPGVALRVGSQARIATSAKRRFQPSSAGYLGRSPRQAQSHARPAAAARQTRCIRRARTTLLIRNSLSDHGPRPLDSCCVVLIVFSRVSADCSDSTRTVRSGSLRSSDAPRLRLRHLGRLYPPQPRLNALTSSSPPASPPATSSPRRRCRTSPSRTAHHPARLHAGPAPSHR